MDNEWDDYADDWDSDESAVLYSNEAFNSLSKIVNVKGANLLDFGCGTGLLTEKLSPVANHIVALDTSSKMLAVLTGKKLPNVTTINEPLSAKLIGGINHSTMGLMSLLLRLCVGSCLTTRQRSLYSSRC